MVTVVKGGHRKWYLIQGVVVPTRRNRDLRDSLRLEKVDIIHLMRPAVGDKQLQRRENATGKVIKRTVGK